MGHRITAAALVEMHGGAAVLPLRVVSGEEASALFDLANAGSAAVTTASSTGYQLQPRHQMEGAHQQVHRDHSIQRRRTLRGHAKHIRRATTMNTRKQCHDREGRRGREA
jgi:hypothetical protein